jgi:hypothetical protein
LKTRRSFSYTIITKILFLTVLLLFAKCKMHYWWLVTWLDLIMLLCIAEVHIWLDCFGTPLKEPPSISNDHSREASHK